MSIKIPHDAPIAIREAFREISEVLDRLTRHNLALHGRRVTGAGDAVSDDDLVTLRQLRDEIGGDTNPSTSSTFDPNWEKINIPTATVDYLRPRVISDRVLIGIANIDSTQQEAALVVVKEEDVADTSEAYSVVATANYNIADTGFKQGLRVNAKVAHSSGSITDLAGIFCLSLKSGAGNITNLTGISTRTDNSNASGSITNAYGIRIETPVNSGTITNKWGLYQVDTASRNLLAGGVTLASAALSTSATDGFTYLPTCAGKPTGTPTVQTGTVPIVYDTTNNRLGFYNSGWKFVGPTPPSCRAYHSVDQSLTTATLTALALNSERFDTDTMHDTATNNSRITFTSAGRYIVGGNVNYEANATGDRGLFIRLNGSTYIASSRVDAAATAGAVTDLNISTYYTFAANDYVELIGYQASGAGLNVLAVGNHTPEFWAVKVSE